MKTIEEIKDCLHTAFLNKGLLIDDDDLEICEYIADSIEFITLIIEIETVLDLEFPDILLSMDAIGTTNSLAAALQDPATIYADDYESPM